MMVRDGDDLEAPLEVLMVRRSLRSAFVGGAYVFPGGAVDPSDGEDAATVLCAGRTDAEASRDLGLPSGGLAYWVAALRECFEEAGLLLACIGASPVLLSLADEADARRIAGHRRGVNGRRRSFVEVCREEGLRLPVDRVHYFSHWVTPVGSPRRFDTRFFVAAAPPFQAPANDAAETIDDVWVRPADALALHRNGEIDLILPTVRSLQAIGRHPTAGALLEAAATAPGPFPVMLPRVVAGAGGPRILLPGDPGYDEAVSSSGPEAGPEFDGVVRSASRSANVEQGPVPPPAGGARPVP